MQPLHVVSAPQPLPVPASVLVLQSDVVHFQSLQNPDVGPVELPDSQLLELAQYPQPDIPVQPPQVLALPQGSVPASVLQSDVVHFQSLQNPDVGPVELPDSQLLELAQYPQPAMPVQPPQVLALPQPVPASGLLLHEETVHFQLLQEPDVGPLELPGSQVLELAQYPQPDIPVQLPQLLALHVWPVPASGVPPPHSLPSHFQELQLPLIGPVLEPDLQLPLPSAQ